MTWTLSDDSISNNSQRHARRRGARTVRYPGAVEFGSKASDWSESVDSFSDSISDYKFKSQVSMETLLIRYCSHSNNSLARPVDRTLTINSS